MVSIRSSSAKESLTVGPIIPVNRNRKCAREQESPRQENEKIRYFDVDFTQLISAPASVVVHFPPVQKNITRWVRCRDYRPHEPESCAVQDRCNFLHVDEDLDKLEKASIQMNYVVKLPENSLYPRLESGPETLLVKESPASEKSEPIPRERIIHTAAFNGGYDPSVVYVQCTVFCNDGYCHFGDHCKYVHILSVNPSLEDGKHKLMKPKPKRPRHSGQVTSALNETQQKPQVPQTGNMENDCLGSLSSAWKEPEPHHPSVEVVAPDSFCGLYALPPQNDLPLDGWNSVSSFPSTITNVVPAPIFFDPFHNGLVPQCIFPSVSVGSFPQQSPAASLLPTSAIRSSLMRAMQVSPFSPQVDNPFEAPPL